MHKLLFNAIEQIIFEYNKAKVGGDIATVDTLKADLEKINIQLSDSDGGTQWEIMFRHQQNRHLQNAS